MALPYYSNDIYDFGLNRLLTNCTMIVALVSEAFSYADATTASGTGTGKMLAQVTVSASDFVLQNGTAPSKRECQFLGKTGTGVATGDPIGFAWLDVTNGKILASTVENGAVSIASGSSVAFPAIKFEFAAATSA